MIKEEEEKKPTFEEIKQQWKLLGDTYSKFDSCPQTYYFSIINVLDLKNAKNILEVACGRCVLVPYTLQLKNKDTSYLGIDISPKMLALAHNFLRSHLERYETNLSYEEWMAKKKLRIRQANGEQPLNEEKKFDRIICNMVLMLTQSAENMLKNLWNQAQVDCLLGISVWANKLFNNFQTEMEKSVEELGLKLPQSRSVYYLYNKVGELAERTGWQVVLSWEQSASFPFLHVSQIEDYGRVSTSSMKTLNFEEKNAVYRCFLRRMNENLEQKKGITFSGQIYVLRKKARFSDS